MANGSCRMCLGLHSQTHLRRHSGYARLELENAHTFSDQHTHSFIRHVTSRKDSDHSTAQPDTDLHSDMEHHLVQIICITLSLLAKSPGWQVGGLMLAGELVQAVSECLFGLWSAIWAGIFASQTW